MKNSLHRLDLLALIPTSGGTAVFLRGDERTFLIQIDPYIGQLIEWYRHGVSQPRPLTHNLFAALLQGINGTLQRVVIHETRDEVFYAQLRVESADDLGRKLIMDLDCRPSDGLALAHLLDAPIYATGNLLDEVEEVSGLLEELQQVQIEQMLQSEAEEEEDEFDDEDDDDFPFDDEDDENEDEDFGQFENPFEPGEDDPDEDDSDNESN